MKTLRALAFALSFAFAVPLVGPGCQTAPSERVAAVLSLKGVGAARDAAMKTAAQLLKDGRISLVQWRRIADLHDHRLQPAYRLAVAVVKADLSSAASPDVVALLNILLETIAEFTNPPAP